jgi:hypothetical protein
MSDWRIHRPEVCCASCERPFEEGAVIFSLLFLDPEALRREDRCPDCFKDSTEAEPREEAAGPRESLFWRTRHVLDKKARFSVDFEAIEELFLSLEGRSEERLCELRYMLSLLLLRKRRLKLVGVRRSSGSEVLCLRRPRRTEEYLVSVFELDSARALALQADLARVFDGAGVEALAVPVVAPEVQVGPVGAQVNPAEPQATPEETPSPS